jgi:hypothetical protein
MAGHRSSVRGIVEIDVTDAGSHRRTIRAETETERSFTAFVGRRLAATVEKLPHV